MEILDHESQTSWDLDTLAAHIWAAAILAPRRSSAQPTCPSHGDFSAPQDRYISARNSPSDFDSIATASPTYNDYDPHGEVPAEPVRLSHGSGRNPESLAEGLEMEERGGEQAAESKPNRTDLELGDGGLRKSEDKEWKRWSKEHEEESGWMANYYAEDEEASDDREGVDLWEVLRKRAKETREMLWAKKTRERRRARRMKTQTMEAVELYTVLLGLLYLGVVDSTAFHCSDAHKFAPLLAIPITLYTAVFACQKLTAAHKSSVSASRIDYIYRNVCLAHDDYFSPASLDAAFSSSAATHLLHAISEAQVELLRPNGLVTLEAEVTYHTPTLLIVSFVFFFAGIVVASWSLLPCIVP